MEGSDQKEAENAGQPAAISTISLSQAILGTLDAIFKAQIHAARSFLNMLLQIGYPHAPVDGDGRPQPENGRPYNQEFIFDVEADGKKQPCKVSIPSLALVPVAPLSVESASFKLEMRVDSVTDHEQMQSSEAKRIEQEKDTDFGSSKRPWFLVSNPISIKGNIAPRTEESSRESASRGSCIQVEIKVGRAPMPAGMDKLLTFLTQSTFTSKMGD